MVGTKTKTPDGTSWDQTRDVINLRRSQFSPPCKFWARRERERSGGGVPYAAWRPSGWEPLGPGRAVCTLRTGPVECMRGSRSSVECCASTPGIVPGQAVPGPCGHPDRSEAAETAASGPARLCGAGACDRGRGRNGRCDLPAVGRGRCACCGVGASARSAPTPALNSRPRPKLTPKALAMAVGGARAQGLPGRADGARCASVGDFGL